MPRFVYSLAILTLVSIFSSASAKAEETKADSPEAQKSEGLNGFRFEVNLDRSGPSIFVDLENLVDASTYGVRTRLYYQLLDSWGLAANAHLEQDGVQVGGDLAYRLWGANSWRANANMIGGYHLDRVQPFAGIGLNQRFGRTGGIGLQFHFKTLFFLGEAAQEFVVEQGGGNPANIKMYFGAGLSYTFGKGGQRGRLYGLQGSGQKTAIVADENTVCHTGPTAKKAAEPLQSGNAMRVGGEWFDISVNLNNRNPQFSFREYIKRCLDDRSIKYFSHINRALISRDQKYLQKVEALRKKAISDTEKCKSDADAAACLNAGTGWFEIGLLDEQAVEEINAINELFTTTIWPQEQKRLLGGPLTIMLETNVHVVSADLIAELKEPALVALESQLNTWRDGVVVLKSSAEIFQPEVHDVAGLAEGIQNAESLIGQVKSRLSFLNAMKQCKDAETVSDCSAAKAQSAQWGTAVEKTELDARIAVLEQEKRRRLARRVKAWKQCLVDCQTGIIMVSPHPSLTRQQKRLFQIQKGMTVMQYCRILDGQRKSDDRYCDYGGLTEYHCSSPTHYGHLWRSNQSGLLANFNVQTQAFWRGLPNPETLEILLDRRNRDIQAEIDRSISQLQSGNPIEPLTILYVGCGPDPMSE